MPHRFAKLADIPIGFASRPAWRSLALHLLYIPLAFEINIFVCGRNTLLALPFISDE
jgi:hypothetical protein